MCILSVSSVHYLICSIVYVTLCMWIDFSFPFLSSAFPSLHCDHTWKPTTVGITVIIFFIYYLLFSRCLIPSLLFLMAAANNLPSRHGLLDPYVYVCVSCQWNIYVRTNAKTGCQCFFERFLKNFHLQTIFLQLLCKLWACLILSQFSLLHYQ